MHCGKIPEEDDQGVDKGKCFAGPHTYKQIRTLRACEFGDVLEDRKLETVEFRILRERNEANIRIATVGFRRADFGMFVDLLGYFSRIISSRLKSGPTG